MHDLQNILERLKLNEEIAQKFHEIETSVLSILNFKDLFEVLLNEIKDKFKVPYTWITLLDKSEVSTLIESLGASETLKQRLRIVEKETFVNLVGTNSNVVLVNDDLKPYYQLLAKDCSYFIKSMAITPLSLDGEVIGSLNQADFSRTRFQPGIDTSLLEQLATKVSLCLSNVTAHEKLKFMAFHDPLTGLLNRRVMETVLEREFKRAQRYLNDLTVVFLDLDDFKSVNDLHGHDAGDHLLKHVANVLIEMSRESDVVARFAGDEFVLILPETRAENAFHLKDRIQAYLRDNPLQINDFTIPAVVSFGVASTEDTSIKSSEELLKRADEALYRAKNAAKKDASSDYTDQEEPKVIALRDVLSEDENGE